MTQAQKRLKVEEKKVILSYVQLKLKANRLSKELDKAFNSRSIRGPAKLGMSLAIPAVDAWARWETEKASLTKQSPKSARLFENSGSFSSSPG